VSTDLGGIGGLGVSTAAPAVATGGVSADYVISGVIAAGGLGAVGYEAFKGSGNQSSSSSATPQSSSGSSTQSASATPQAKTESVTHKAKAESTTPPGKIESTTPQAETSPASPQAKTLPATPSPEADDPKKPGPWEDL
jgi:hypothetical protein